MLLLVLKISSLEALPEILIPVQNSNADSDTECVAAILKAVLPCTSTLTFIDINDAQTILIQDMNKLTCYLIQNTNYFNCPRKTYPAEAYIFSVNTVTDLDKAIKCISQNIFWNPTAYFVVMAPNSNDDKELSNFFEVFLLYRISQAIVLKSLQEATHIYTYSPYANGICGKSIGNVLNLGDCNKVKGQNRDYFQNQVPSTIKNCTMVVAGGEDVPNFIIDSTPFQTEGKPILGHEQLIIEIIAKIEEIKVEYQYGNATMRYGVILPNNSATGILSKLYWGEADVAAGGFMLIENRAQKFDYEWGYHYGHYNLFTHAEVEHRWEYIHKEFSVTTWALILVVFIASVLMTYMISRMLTAKISSHGYRPVYLIINLWGYLFANPSSSLNSNKAFRTALLGWIWFTFFIGNFYMSALYSSITSRPRKSQTKDLNYLVENGYRPCISETTRHFFPFAFNNQTLPEGPYRPECEIMENIFSVVSTELDAYTIEPDYLYRLKECELLDDEGYPLLEEWKFSHTLITALHFNRGSPFIKPFRKYVNTIYESGLIQKQEFEISFNNKKLCFKKVKLFHKYNMKDLRTPFILLFIGSILSLITCIFEIQRNKHRF